MRDCYFTTALFVKKLPARHWFDLISRYEVASPLILCYKGKEYNVEKGFITDFASTCRVAQYFICSLLAVLLIVYCPQYALLSYLPLIIFTQDGPWSRAAVVHDKFSKDWMFLRSMLVDKVFPPFAIIMYCFLIFKPLYKKVKS